jgi:uncharacterized 2Fe-2S/4Fe-4S cluster protein (DUF4445 family)
MSSVTFQPLGRTVDVPAGTPVLDAVRRAGIDMEAPCGGKGTCGKCIVRIVSGDVETDHMGLLTTSAVNRGYRLACRTKILQHPVEVEVPEQTGKEGGQFIDETDDTCLSRKELFPPGHLFKPLTAKAALDVPGPRLADGLSDLDRLSRAVQRQFGNKAVHYPLPVIRSAAGDLREQDGKVTVSVVEEEQRLHVIRVEPGDLTGFQYGIAIDIGTTTVAVQLVSLPGAGILATQTAYNKQIDRGLDVISRINYARKPGRLNELRTRVLKTVNLLIRQLCKGNEVNPLDIENTVIAGNTTMIHLLLGLPPEFIRLEPYTPTILESPRFSAEEVGIDIYPYSRVYLSPSVGSYVGGDITAGLLCTHMNMDMNMGMASDSEEIGLFLDIGTNGELVIGNNDFLMACACSAGPAFEGGGIGMGMRAALGAVEKVDVDKETGAATFQTIGHVAPKGICGTGMISLLANLFVTGWLDAAGKLNRAKPSPAIRVEGRQARYIIAGAEESGTGKEISISEIDIDNIIRAKAAIYAACALLLEQVGLGFDDIANIYIAGGFGRFLDIGKAIIIGLLPDLPREIFHYIGNSSLMGAYKALVSPESRDKQLELSRRMTYVELSTDPAYMDQFTGACFLPHTDDKRFPSLKELLKSNE